MFCTNIVLKVASLCNLNCTYCYVYNKGDESYKRQPKIMSEIVVEETLKNIKRHCEKFDIKNFLIVFHGGEPLLTGIEFYNKFIKKYEEIFNDSVIKIDFALQTNGVLLTEEIVSTFKKLNIIPGISLDGTPESNNKNRIYHNGKGSYNDILNGFNLVKKIFGNGYANCLCVVDINENPKEVYSHFKKIGVNEVNLLFPDNNFESKTNNNEDFYNWLINIFEIWYSDADNNKPQIKLFSDLIGLILGEPYCGNEMYGKRENSTLVVETNGSIETVDTLKVCGNGFTNTNINVFKNELNDIYKLNALSRKYYYSHNDISQKCVSCELVEVCGGGFLAHRYSSLNGFDNPSVYCLELAKLICYIQNRLYSDLPIELQNEIEKINYDDIKEFNEN